MDLFYHNIIFQNGNTLLHMAAQHSSAMVYASVMQGLELNVKNFVSNTHIRRMGFSELRIHTIVPLLNVT